jgi:hypothetical protein
MAMTINLEWPKRFICVQSSSLPQHELSFNEIAEHIARNTNRTPLERMEDLLTEKTYGR